MYIHRRYLPHIEIPKSTYFITFRLFDSIPLDTFLRLKRESAHVENLTPPEIKECRQKYLRKIEEQLDSSYGNCWLRIPDVAGLVADAIQQFNHSRYELHAWCIMPNHVHVLFSPFEGNSLSTIMHSWKSFTAHKANRFLRRNGRFWEPEYFDRLIRNERHFFYAARYTLRNPVKAGLCESFEKYLWKGASELVQDHMKRFLKVENNFEE